MKLELPDNNASVLFHMGNALQSIARDIDTSLPVNGHKSTHTETVGDVSHSVTVEPLMVMATGDKNPINIDASERRYLDESELSDAVDNMIDAIAAEHEIPVNRLTGNTTGTGQYGKSVLSDCLDDIAAFTEVSDTIDADGLPWDQRIHSRGKTRLDDNTWRMARKPKDKTDEEWAEYVETVKVELRELMAIPVATVELPVQPLHDCNGEPCVDQGCDAMAQFVEDIAHAEVNAGNLPPVVSSATFEGTASGFIGVGQPVAVVAPPVVDTVVALPVVDAVVAPPVVDAVVAPPVVDAVVTGPTTFPELMKFITVNNKKLTKESVDEALKAQGLASIALLAARTDLIPQVHAALVKLL